MSPFMPQHGGQPSPPTLAPAIGGPAAGNPTAQQPTAQQLGRHPATDGGEVDPQQVDQFLEKAFQTIYGGDTEDGQLSGPVAGMLRKSANDPTQALATTAAQIAAKVVTSAMDANVSLDPAAAMLGMFEIVGELASVASAEGIYDYGQDELSAAAVRSGEILHGLFQDTGFVSQGEAMTDVSELARASQTGELDQAITQLEKAGQGGGMPEDGPDAHALAMIRYGASSFS